MAMTVIGCIFCLTHTRGRAAADLHRDRIAGRGRDGAILLIDYRDFTNLVESQTQLRAKQAETRRLSDDNFRLANREPLSPQL